jgi:polyisoprenoid-binding protein YceI
VPGGKRHWLRWLVGGLAVIVVAAVAGPFIYIHFIEGSAPAPFRLRPSASASGSGATTQPASTSDNAGALPGTWAIGSGSQVGYRVQEVLFGQQHTAVGRTGEVTGHLTIAGTSVTAASFTAQMDTVRSDASQRDAQFDGRIMDTATYPTGTFALTSPISLAPVPAAGVVKSYTAHGNLTLHGTTRPVTFTLSAERTTSGIQVTGSIPVLFASWHIPNPSFGGVVTTQDHGLLEFLLTLHRS